MTAVLEPPGSGLPALGAYQLLERIGAGGLGEVYRARDTVHGRTVAIKRVPSVVTADSTRSSGLVHAASKLATVSHPGVAALYEWGLSEGQMFLALEFVAGQRLDEIVGGRALHPRRAIEIGLEIVEALAALHAAGLVHGDVRPANIVITPKGHAKLLDSGLAPFTAGGSLRASAGKRLGGLPASASQIVGYVSPEQAAGEPSDARGDLFAFGCVLYEMLTGAAPFDRPTPDATLLAVLQSQPHPPSATIASVPTELDLIVMRALAKSLDRRYPTATALADDLRLAKSVLDSDVERRALFREPATSPFRRRALVLGAILVALSAAAWWIIR
jgi:serine/threonine protein kinase